MISHGKRQIESTISKLISEFEFPLTADFFKKGFEVGLTMQIFKYWPGRAFFEGFLTLLFSSVKEVASQHLTFLNLGDIILIS